MFSKVSFFPSEELKQYASFLEISKISNRFIYKTHSYNNDLAFYDSYVDKRISMLLDSSVFNLDRIKSLKRSYYLKELIGSNDFVFTYDEVECFFSEYESMLIEYDGKLQPYTEFKLEYPLGHYYNSDDLNVSMKQILNDYEKKLEKSIYKAILDKYTFSGSFNMFYLMIQNNINLNLKFEKNDGAKNLGMLSSILHVLKGYANYNSDFLVIMNPTTYIAYDFGLGFTQNKNIITNENVSANKIIIIEEETATFCFTSDIELTTIQSLDFNSKTLIRSKYYIDNLDFTKSLTIKL